MRYKKWVIRMKKQKKKKYVQIRHQFQRPLT